MAQSPGRRSATDRVDSITSVILGLCKATMSARDEAQRALRVLEAMASQEGRSVARAGVRQHRKRRTRCRGRVLEADEAVVGDASVQR